MQGQQNDNGWRTARHRTAIGRSGLSTPVQALARHGLLDGEVTLLDYGCGQGDDVMALRAGGIAAVGWDPHFAPDGPLEPADMVNLGFVLNVIEEPAERREALRRAFELARLCLAVAVMVVGKVDTTGLQPYRDGFLTRRGTFQKYYRQDELKAFLEAELATEAIAVAPGVFFVFRDKLLEQRFLLDRQRRRTAMALLDLRPPRDRPAPVERRVEALRPLLERLWRRMLDHGRPVHDNELDPELAGELARQVGSLRKAERLCRSLFDPAALVTAGGARGDDLLVYFALNLFNGCRPYSALPPELQRDVKVFLGSHARAEQAGRDLLFSVGCSGLVEAACREASHRGLGRLDDGHSLQLHGGLVERLPPILRCYVGCAAKLYGDVDGADLVKIHIRSGKLTLLFYDDFTGSPLPRLRERIKIDMRAQRIDFFDHLDSGAPQLLYLKSRYMAPDQDGYEQQSAFDAELERLGLFDLSGFGPRADALAAGLAAAGYRVDRFRLVKLG